MKMKKNSRSMIAVFLSLVMLLSLGMGAAAVRAEELPENSQTIDGTNREHGIAQIQTVIPDYNFASAVYDSLKTRKHFGDGTQSVKDVLAAYTGNIYAEGYMIVSIYEASAQKKNAETGEFLELIEKRFDSREEAEAYLATLVDTAEFIYENKNVYLSETESSIPKEDTMLIHNITGIEWLRKANAIYLAANKISDLSLLDIDHISDLAEEAGETDSAVLYGEKWFGEEGRSTYIDLKNNPITRYPSTLAGRLEIPKSSAQGFEIEVSPYILVKEDGKECSAEIVLPRIERDGRQINIKENGIQMIGGNLPGIGISICTGGAISLRGLTHSGIARIKIEGAENSAMSFWHVDLGDSYDLCLADYLDMNFCFDQSIRIYNPISLLPSCAKTVIHLEKTAENTGEAVYLKGAMFRLYQAEFVDGSYVPAMLYSETEYMTDENGTITIEEELPTGDYCLVEEKAPENYVKKETPFGFSVGGLVSLTGGTREFTPMGGDLVEAAENKTYIDRYSPDISLFAEPMEENTVEKVVLTYFDREEQKEKEIVFYESDGNAVENAQNWINSNKGDEEHIGRIDGSVWIRVVFCRAPLEFTAANQGVGGITVSVGVSGNAADRTKKFSFTVRLGDSTINGTYGEMDFVDGAAVFELADGESISARELPNGISYQVSESGNEDYTVTSENETGRIKTGGMAAVVFYNHKEETESEHNYIVEITREATCTQSGLKTYTCACGDSYTKSIGALGHLYRESVTKQPTTAEKGIMTYICERCGDRYTSLIDKLPGGNTPGESDPGNTPGGNQPGGSQPGEDQTGNTSEGEQPGGNAPEGDESEESHPENTPGDSQLDESSKEPGGEPFILAQDQEESAVAQSGWLNIRRKINSTEEGDTIVVNMNGTRLVPGGVLDRLKGRDITVVFDVGGGFAWSVNGQSLTADQLADIDLSANIRLLRGDLDNGPYLARRLRWRMCLLENILPHSPACRRRLKNEL